MVRALLPGANGQAAQGAHEEPAMAAGHAPVEHGGEQSLGEMIMHHVVDAREIELPWGAVWELPHWEPIQVAGLTIDLSPTKHVVFMLMGAIVLAVLMIWTAKRTHGKDPHRAPGGIANVIEAFVIYIRDEVALKNIGHGGERFVPYVLTLFFFILFANLLGLLPWGATATANLSVTAALAILSLIVIEVSGFMALGARQYAKTIFFVPEGMGPVGSALMLVVMTPVELLGKLAKPFALAIRLFANMNSGHFVILSLIGLIFVAAPIAGWVLPIIAPVVMAVAIMLLEIFVGFLQAYIFAMLTAVFIGLIRHAH
ncbi:MAG: F0F1 ATP synthase subunit A [Longimicrobiales bacterium]